MPPETTTGTITQTTDIHATKETLIKEGSQVLIQKIKPQPFLVLLGSGIVVFLVSLIFSSNNPSFDILIKSAIVTLICSIFLTIYLAFFGFLKFAEIKASDARKSVVIEMQGATIKLQGEKIKELEITNALQARQMANLESDLKMLKKEIHNLKK